MNHPDDMTYRLLSEVDDLRQVVGLQHLIWGHDPEALIGLNILQSLAAAGNPIIGAFDESLLVGFSIGFLGLTVRQSNRPAIANLKLASKRLAVHPDYRSNGIARQMKIEQYKFAQIQGIRLVTWTFDPLISRNAYLYIRKLGAVVRQFIPNYYADIMGQVDAIGGTDRMLCEWWVTSNRVEERLFGNRKGLGVKQYLEGNAPILNPTEVTPDGRLLPIQGSFTFANHHLLLVEVPSDPNTIRDESLGMSWREHTRAIFDQVFLEGYIVTDFVHEIYEDRERSFYVFGYDGQVGV